MITPCSAWTEKLALRREDLSLADREALDAHLATCSACRKVLDDYNFLDEALKALPSITVKPLPRLILVPDEPELLEDEDSEPNLLERAPKSYRSRSVPRRAHRMLPAAVVASFLLCVVLVSGMYYTMTTGARTLGTTLFIFK